MNEYQTLTSREALDRMRAGAVLIDVRDDEEFAEGHVAGALHVPLDALQARIDEIPKGRELLVFCRSGRRSGIAQKQLIDSNGCAQVANVEGGILAWEEAGLPIERGH